jgi:hypothetical protein
MQREVWCTCSVHDLDGDTDPIRRSVEVVSRQEPTRLIHDQLLWLWAHAIDL